MLLLFCAVSNHNDVGVMLILYVMANAPSSEACAR
jgi:hypothetical protein